jgi:hypothetical protein
VLHKQRHLYTKIRYVFIILNVNQQSTGFGYFHLGSMNCKEKKDQVYLIKGRGPVGASEGGNCSTGHWGVVAEISQENSEVGKVFKFDAVIGEKDKIKAKMKPFESINDLINGLKPNQEMFLYQRKTLFSLDKATAYCKEVNDGSLEYNILTDNCQEFATELIKAATEGWNEFPDTFGWRLETSVAIFTTAVGYAVVGAFFGVFSSLFGSLEKDFELKLMVGILLAVIVGCLNTAALKMGYHHGLFSNVNEFSINKCNYYVHPP